MTDEQRALALDLLSLRLAPVAIATRLGVPVQEIHALRHPVEAVAEVAESAPLP
jgi:hypothetical protein